MARQMVRSALAEWDLMLFEDIALLLATELMSNGVRHAMTLLTLEMSYEDGCLRVGVSDRDTHQPVLNRSSQNSVHGWGLHMVDLLASGWGTTTKPNGKTVWFELRTPQCPG